MLRDSEGFLGVLLTVLGRESMGVVVEAAVVEQDHSALREAEVSVALLSMVLVSEIFGVGVEVVAVAKELSGRCILEGREYAASHIECAAVPGWGNACFPVLCKLACEVDSICREVLLEAPSLSSCSLSHHNTLFLCLQLSWRWRSSMNL